MSLRYAFSVLADILDYIGMGRIGSFVHMHQAWVLSHLRGEGFCILYLIFYSGLIICWNIWILWTMLLWGLLYWDTTLQSLPLTNRSIMVNEQLDWLR